MPHLIHHPGLADLALAVLGVLAFAAGLARGQHDRDADR